MNYLKTTSVSVGKALRKQMLRKRTSLRNFTGEGLTLAIPVCNHIARRENRVVTKEAFIRQVYQAGETCEFDWGEIKLCIAGKRRSLQLAVFTSAFSNYRYAFIYERQDTLAFMESHVRFFKKIGGVYREMVYDNMRVAVARFVGPHEKEPTRSLLQLRGHYQFRHRFCNIYRGNEKGHVERSVEYVRRKAFALKTPLQAPWRPNSGLTQRWEGSMRGSSREQAKAPTNCFHKRRTSWASIRHGACLQ